MVSSIDDPIPNGHARISSDRIEMARRLEVPVFRLIRQCLRSKLGKPIKESFAGEPWKVVWQGSHIYTLLYFRRPQTADVEGQPLPDFILEMDEQPRVAIEAKNWSLTSKWSLGSAKKQVVDRFAWLPVSCDRIVLASHLQANGPRETMKILGMMRENGIRIYVLGSPAGYPPLTGQRLYARLAPIVAEWLGFIRARRRRKTRIVRGQKRLPI